MRLISVLLFLCVPVFLLGGCGGGVTTLPAMTVFPTADTAGNEPSEGAAWSSQLAFAQAEAAKIDKQAVVYWVQSGPITQSFSESSILQVHFIFIRPDGTWMKISISDTTPPTLVNVYPQFGTVTAPTAAELEKYQQLLSTIKLGPRDVYRRTQAEGGAFAGTAPLSASIGLYLDRDFQADLNTPVAWIVSYTVYGRSDAAGALLDPQRMLGLAVDPASGVVLKRNEVEHTT
ncbi:MAG: hypothetical protein M3390_05345 [Chloroflexota bacterium]|nr:hypothetical protein [Chloroflexota bacterium]